MASETDRARQAMVDIIARRGGVRDNVLAAMRAVPRHELVPEWNRHLAYADRAISIGAGATMSQPYIVAYMTDAANVAPGDRVLEIGTGSAYQALVLAMLGCEVFTMEIIPELVERAEVVLARMRIPNVHVRLGDGHRGWPEAAPFAAVLVTAAPEEIPGALVDQLEPGGRLVIPVGGQDELQTLHVFERVGGDLKLQQALPVRFIPLTRGDPLQ
jgi:protein-L-isoaspartate(D-aspartate) O-methyltransferase